MHSQKHRTNVLRVSRRVSWQFEVSEGEIYSEALVFPMDFPRTYERMAIWSAMPTSLLGAGLGAGSGSSFFGSILLGAGSMSALRNSSHWNFVFYAS